MIEKKLERWIPQYLYSIIMTFLCGCLLVVYEAMCLGSASRHSPLEMKSEYGSTRRWVLPKGTYALWFLCRCGREAQDWTFRKALKRNLAWWSYFVGIARVVVLPDASFIVSANCRVFGEMYRSDHKRDNALNQYDSPLLSYFCVCGTRHPLLLELCSACRPLAIRPE
jgi:hypothetical protein